MTMINTGTSGGYYQLNSSNSNNSGNSAQTSRSNNTALASLLAATNGQQQNVSNSAYLLDLSPEAQKYLAASNQQNPVSSLFGNGQQSFVLNAKQKAQISEIIAKYKDEPFTQETYNKLQDELNARGVGPNQLAMIDKATSFNPTQILVGALTGRSTQEADIDGSKAQAKVDYFMQQIVGEWKKISTTADDAAQSTDEASGDEVAPAGGTAES